MKKKRTKNLYFGLAIIICSFLVAGIVLAITWTQRNMTSTSGWGQGIIAVDFELQGATDYNRIDMFVTTRYYPTCSGGCDTAWHESNGAALPSFTRYVIDYDNGGTYEPDLTDLDSDGDLDIVSPQSIGNKIVWYKNDGNSCWTSATDCTELTIDSSCSWGSHTDSGDLDGDNDIDVVGTCFGATPDAFDANGDSINWYENNGSESFTEHLIAGGTSGDWRDRMEDVQLIDLDNDNDLDIVAACSRCNGTGGGTYPGRSVNKLSWFENNGSGSFTERVISTSYVAYRIDLGDLENDGDIDIASEYGYSSYCQVNYWANDGTLLDEGSPANDWTRYVVKVDTAGDPIEGCADIDIGNINGDNYNDIVTSAYTTQKVYYFQNAGGCHGPGGCSWTEEIVDSSEAYAATTDIADVDGDGFMDIPFMTNVGSTKWYENGLTENDPPIYPLPEFSSELMKVFIGVAAFMLVFYMGILLKKRSEIKKRK